ncbi:MAG: hypothetical protein ACLRSE_03970 [Alistipes finegoldii]
MEAGAQCRQDRLRRRHQPAEPERRPRLRAGSDGRAERRAGFARRSQTDARREKLAQHRATAEKQAREAAEERLRLERERADSLAQAEFEQAAAAGEEQPEILPATDNDGFFD